MNLRNKILLALLVVQIGVLALVYRPVQEGPAATGQPLFPGLAGEDVQAVIITGEDGGMIRLVRQEQGWQIVAARASESEDPGPSAIEPPLPADALRMEELAGQLTGLQAVRLVTRTRASHGRLQVAEEHFVRRIELSTGDGRSAVLFLGSAPSFKTVHARRSGESEVYLVEGITTWETDTDLVAWSL
jgi:hypothetical protein